MNKNEITTEALEAAIKNILDSYDWGYGGWGSAPKFQQPMTIEFLLYRATTDTTQREQIIEAVTHALSAMSRGRLYDVVGGGFSRYSVDNFGERLTLKNAVQETKISTKNDPKRSFFCVS